MRSRQLPSLHSRKARKDLSAAPRCADHSADSCLKLRDQRLPRYSNRYARLSHIVRLAHLQLRRAGIPADGLLHKGLLRDRGRQGRSACKSEANNKTLRLPVVLTPNINHQNDQSLHKNVAIDGQWGELECEDFLRWRFVSPVPP